MKIAFLCLIALVILYIIWQRNELKKFEITDYEISSGKLEKSHRLVVLADLHNVSFGENNQRLLEAVLRQNPQAILIPGDFITSLKPHQYMGETEANVFYRDELNWLKRLTEIAPVFYSLGNHENKMKVSEDIRGQVFASYEKELIDMGVHVLDNSGMVVCLGQDRLQLVGLTLDHYYFRKGRRTPMEDDYVRQCLNSVEDNPFYRILLAHNPAYFKNYLAARPDLVVSGHNHGGLVRIPGIGSLISPQFELFPKYDAGRFQEGNASMVISRGLGTHKFHIRIFNRAELVTLTLTPEKGVHKDAEL